MANEQNLRPSEYKLTQEEQKRGGIASGKARREKADLRKVIQSWMKDPVTVDKNGNPMTGAELMAMVAVKQMSQGSARHWELLRDTAGFKPIDRIMVAEVDQEVIAEVEAAVMEESLDDNGQETSD